MRRRTSRITYEELRSVRFELVDNGRRSACVLIFGFVDTDPEILDFAIAGFLLLENGTVFDIDWNRSSQTACPTFKPNSNI